MVQEESCDCHSRQTVRLTGDGQTKSTTTFLSVVDPEQVKASPQLNQEEVEVDGKASVRNKRRIKNVSAFQVKKAQWTCRAPMWTLIYILVYSVNILYVLYLSMWVAAEVVWTCCLGPTCRQSNWERLSSTPSEKEEKKMHYGTFILRSGCSAALVRAS